MTPVMHLVGWALIHFVWQGSALALAAAVALRLCRRSATRYAVACLGLIAMLAAPFATLASITPSITPSPHYSITPFPVGASPGASPIATLDGSPLSTVSGVDHTPMEPAAAREFSETAIAAVGGTADRYRLMLALVVCWMAGVAVLLGRLAVGWWQVNTWHASAMAQPSSAWLAAGERIAGLMGLSRVPHIVDSEWVDVPTVVGWLRPLILLPVAALANLTPAQVDSILAHELAHVRRHDYLVNVLQTLTETLLFYHPAVWWMSARAREEREHCCDQIAVDTCGDAADYARALVELESWRVSSATIALAATGGSLFDRVRRIMHAPATDEPRPNGWIVMILLVALFTAGAGAIDWLHANGEATTGAAVAEHYNVSSISAFVSRAHLRFVRMIHAHLRGLRHHVGLTRDVGAGDASMALNQARVNPTEIRADLAAAQRDLESSRRVDERIGRDLEGSRRVVERIGRDLEGSRRVDERIGRDLEGSRRVVERIRRFSVGPEAPEAPEPPEPPAPPEPQTSPVLPVAPTPPTPPAPPAPPARGHSSSDSEFRMDTSFLCFAVPCAHGAEVRARGNFGLKEDLTDVESLSDGGYLIVRVWSLFIPHTIEIRAESGTLTHRYFVAGLWRPYDSEARRLLASQLLSIVRHSPLGARSRTRQILALRGAVGVLDEIRRLDGDFVRGVYFRELFDATHLDSSTMARALVLAGELISSDFERSRTLRAAAPVAAGDTGVANAYVETANRMSSDFEHQRALLALLQTAPPAPAVRELVARSAARLHSDFEKSLVLRSLLTTGPIDASDPLFSAVRSMSSDFEKSRVLRQLLTNRNLPLEVKKGVLEAVPSISSDFEQSRVLRAMVDAEPLDPTLRTAFLGAADHIGSSFEQNRVLAALVKGERR